MMKLITGIVVLLCLLIAFPKMVQAEERINFDADWKFQLDDQPGAEAIAYDDKDWRSLHLPHDWSIEGDFDEANPMGASCGYLPAGKGWYRKTIDVPANWKGKQIELAFDGVFNNSTVWVNGKKLGFRPYGWVSFGYDITEAVANADKLTVAVEVNNEKQPAARWYTGSGIYANTWIKVREKIHVPTDGVFVRTENNSSVMVDTDVANRGNDAAKGVLITSVLDPSGSVLSIVREPFEIQADQVQQIQQTLQLNDPALWSLETPNLHTFKTEIEVGGQVLDTVRTRFGVRDVQWRPKTGMWLNGKNVKLQGVCNHNDAGALGAAVPDKILRFRINQLKSMGCNAIRPAHKVQTPQFYDMCDEIGMLVMDEFFDGWRKKAQNDYGAHSFKQWWRRDLEDLIKRDRNHPSIVIYSIGNETHGEVAQEMVAHCHKIDDTRPVTSGNCAPRKMDVYGVNGGSERRDFFDNLDAGNKVFIATENPHTWHNRGFYRTKYWYRDGQPNDKNRANSYPEMTEVEVFQYDWTDGSDRIHGRQTLRSSYDNSTVRVTARHNIQLLRDIPYFAGSFRWTGYDYLGEAGYHGAYPFKSFSGGAMDMANFEKDLYYLYQSQWTDQPMVHVLPHWTHPTLKLGTEIPIWVYSNCDEVELFFDGKSLGKQTPGDQHNEMQCQWMVGWQPGELKAVGYVGGLAKQEEVVRTASHPTQIRLTVDGEPLANADRDIVQVRVASADAEGNFYPYGENRTYFHVIGAGKVRALDNGSPLDVEKYFEAESRKGFFGLTRAYIESNDPDGPVALLASSILGEKKLITSNQVSIDTKMIALRDAPPEPDVIVFYTTDGSVPTEASPRYTAPFDVSLGTTVKALVVVDGSPVHMMEERFASDVGFAWKTSAKGEMAVGEQAESGKFENAKNSNAGKGFHGKGHVEFDGPNARKGFVEWYFENDGSAGEFDLWIRYSAKRENKIQHRAILSVNGKEEEIVLTPVWKFRHNWKLYKAKGKLGAGANNIRLTPLAGNGLCVDELIVK